MGLSSREARNRVIGHDEEGLNVVKKKKTMSEWLSQTLINLIVTSAVFVAGLYATQQKTVDQIASLSNNVDKLATEMTTAIEKSEKRQTDAIKLLRADFKEMQDDIYQPKFQIPDNR